jgi:hypothetical protein
MRQAALMALVALLSLTPFCFGQAIDANLVGSVVDATGAVVPDATIEVTQVATGVKTSTKTAANGTYRLNNIPVGLYNLAASAQGFATINLKGIDVQLSKTSTVNVALQVGTIAQSVDVSEAGVVIDTTTSQVQSNFESRQIVALPIIENANSFFGALNLSLLGAGVASNGGVGQGTGPSVGGQRPMNNNFMIEGVDNNNKTVTGPLVYVPTESTAEFTLLQNQYGAEFGHSSGGQFNTVIKSGNNAMHGSLYEYFQNRNLNALDATFRNTGFTSQPRYDQNKLGGSIGGPIKKDKLFYFGNVEYAPMGAANTSTSPVYGPTAAGFALLDKMTNISKTNYSIFKQYVPPASTSSDVTPVNGVNIPIGVLQIPGNNFVNFWTYLASVDYNVSSKDQIRGRFIANKYDSLDNAANLPAFWTTLPQRFYIGSVAEYHNFSPTVTNELRLSYNRFTQFYIVPDFKYPGLDVFPNIQLDNDLGLQIGPDPNGPQYSVQNTYQLVENLNITRGAHTVKVGYDGRDVISPQHFIQRERGDYDYSTLNEFLNDNVPDDQAQRNLGTTPYYGNQWAHYLYANDNWRAKKNFTVNLGIRWERTGVPLTQQKQALNSVANVPGLIDFHAPKTANKNFAPRIGIAYSPGDSGRTSIRAGFAMAYDVIFDNVGSTAYPPQLSSTYDAGSYPNIFATPFLANGGIKPGSFPGGTTLNAADARANTSSFLPDQELPYSISWNAGVQHVFKSDYTFESRYMGTRGVHLITQNRLNIQNRVTNDAYLPTYLAVPTQAQLNALPTTLAAISAKSNYVPAWANAGFNGASVVGFMPWGNSVYHGWANQLTKRFSKGLQFTAAYTFSHNIDDSTATHYSTVLTPRRAQDFRNMRAERSNSALDRRHRATMSWVYELPFMKSANSWAAKNIIGNWSVSGTFTAESGEFVTAQSGTDSNLNGDTVDRTVLNPNGNSKLGSDVTALTNSAGATVAYLATNPNAMYIKAGKGALATAGKNTIPMPGINNFDISLAKALKICEAAKFEFRADFTNFFNHPQYTAGLINSVKLTSQTTSNTFLQPANSQFQNWSQNFSSNSRTVQLGAKISF